ncbi:MAG: hypothetical protein MH204_08265, partial [Fimbriimonadaceae bacterium]|nr:hypothetical protein [Fimbriimonadaceae bacterium]
MLGRVMMDGMAKRRSITPEDLLTLQFPGDPHVNPKDGRVAFCLRRFSAKNRMVGQIHVLDPETGRNDAWTHQENGAGHARWSPQGDRLAFVAKRGERPQIHVMPAGGGEARPLTDFPEGSLGWFQWSPDGSKLLVSFRETPAERTSAASESRRKAGDSTPPWVIEDPMWRMDGDGFFGEARFRLWLVDAQTGEHSLLYDRNPEGSPASVWLPDSSGIIVVHTRNAEPCFQTTDDGFWRVDLKGKAKAIPCSVPGGKGTPRISPDGGRLAWIGCDREEGWGVFNRRLWVMDLKGGEPTCLTADSDEDFGVMTLSDTNPGHVSDGGGSGFLVWTPDGSGLLAGIGKHGFDGLIRVDAETGAMTWLVEGPQSL